MRKTVIAFILLVLVSFFSANGQDTLVFDKKYLPSINKTLVFIPQKQAQPAAGYPLVYLLHGYSGSSADWNSHTSIQDFADRYGFVIVCPDGYYNAWYVNSPFVAENQYVSFFKNDLIPIVHQKYKIDSSAIFITGLSMGGHGAINFFIDNQQYFLSAGSMSGIMDITAFPGKWEISKLLGDYEVNRKNWEAYSCVKKLNLLKTSKKTFLIDCGTEDFAYPVNKNLKKAADSLGLEYSYICRPGKHDWDYWVKSLPIHLDFFKALIKKKTEK